MRTAMPLRSILFQSTYLYKVRQDNEYSVLGNNMFQSTYLYKVRLRYRSSNHFPLCFNPRTYIRYDDHPRDDPLYPFGFNPRTYIRYDLLKLMSHYFELLFQSTYLYKVRLTLSFHKNQRKSFNPRTYIRYDISLAQMLILHYSFNPRTYIRYDPRPEGFNAPPSCFNPRTYIRYDCITNNANIYSLLSMHLCDNKLFGFFIDEIKLIGVFNRLIINDCENSSFLLMLNVRKQLYYKFIFYIIGCDDTYVFNSFRIIISQEIETNTIFFMIDDIR